VKGSYLSIVVMPWKLRSGSHQWKILSLITLEIKIGLGVTTDTPCFSLSVIGGVMEATVVPEIPVPVVLISLPSKRGWYQWCGTPMENTQPDYP
jgi:hypothetical protein